MKPNERQAAGAPMEAQQGDREAEVEAHLAAWRAGAVKKKTSEECASQAPEGDEGLVGWYDETMSARHWFSLIAVGSADATMLLCNHDPSPESNDMATAARCTNDEIDPRKFAELHRRFVDLDSNRPRTRSLLDWLRDAREMHVPYHSWIDKYVNARPELGELLQRATQPAPPPRHIPASLLQEAAILAKLTELGFDPQRIPPTPAGKASPAKKAVREVLGYSDEVFRKAWARLRSSGQINDA